MSCNGGSGSSTRSGEGDLFSYKLMFSYKINAQLAEIKFSVFHVRTLLIINDIDMLVFHLIVLDEESEGKAEEA